MKRLLAAILPRGSRQPAYRPRTICRAPQPPIGFVRRTDPNFFFLARKF